MNDAVQRNVSDSSILVRVRSFNSALDRLMRLYTTNSVSIGEFLNRVTEETCIRLNVQRVSIWDLSATADSIYCADLYTTEDKKHFNGATLSAEDFPNYFAAMLNERVIDADNAETDSRTAEFCEPYLKPNHIKSMLDAQIRSATGPRGVVCAETVSTQRTWSPDEVAFFVSIAELVGFFLDRLESQRVYSELEEVNLQINDAIQSAKEANERYNLAMDAAFDGVWDWDLKTGEIYFTKQNSVLLGESSATQATDFVASIDWWKSRVHPVDQNHVLQDASLHIDSNAPYNVMYRIRHQDGHWRWWRSRGQVVRDKSNRPERFVGTNSDITSLIHAQRELETRNQELEVAKKEIEAAALHDSLTGLPNRRYMEQELDVQIKDALRNGENIAFMHIDLDLFKEVNDSLGHAAGDFVLKHVADILRKHFEHHFVARIGGDEFVAVIPDPTHNKPWQKLAQELLNALNQTIFYGNNACKIGVSLGVASLDNQTLDASQLLSNADIALYRAKNLGRNRMEVFTQDMRTAMDNKRILHQEIIEALNNNEFIPHFQPQFYADTLSLSGIEALVRWEHPTRGLLYPPDFLDSAEELNCVSEIDRQILEKSLKIMAEWKEQGLNIPRLSVNVSNGRLSDPFLTSSVKTLNIEPNTLCFELLESIFLDETDEQVSSNLDQLNKMGVQVEVDDFGTGYASIASLINIKPHRLKIDRSLVMNIEEDQKISGLVRSIVDIAKTLNIEVVAEGVETQAQIEALSNLGCQILQGYALGRPIDKIAFFERFKPAKEN